MTKNIAKMIVIPSGSVEQIVKFGPVSSPAQPIWMSGYGYHKSGYLIHQPHAKRHIFLYCLKGEYYYYLSGKKEILQSNQMLYLPAGSDQHFGLEKGDGEAIFFLLTPESCEHRSAQCLNGNSGPLLKQLMLRAFAEQKNSADDSAILAGCLSLIVRLIYADMNFTESRTERLDALVAKLRQKPGASWTVGSMAAECCMAQSYFFVLCKKYLSCSPHQLLLTIRIEYASQMLTQTDYSIKVISEMCGYACQFTFSRIFAQVVGESPSAYRKHATLKRQE